MKKHLSTSNKYNFSIIYQIYKTYSAFFCEVVGQLTIFSIISTGTLHFIEYTQIYTNRTEFKQVLIENVLNKTKVLLIDELWFL